MCDLIFFPVCGRIFGKIFGKIFCIQSDIELSIRLLPDITPISGIPETLDHNAKYMKTNPGRIFQNYDVSNQICEISQFSKQSKRISESPTN